MIPSTLAAEVGGALQDFLATGFGSSNRALSSVVDDFLADADNLLKGPYLSVELPLQRAPDGGEPFPKTPLGFIPYRHQRIAFDRLASGQSTVIATGTGSGKTECFLYPVLDHCRERSGTPGVKAIFIYPMNALASDQARRIAGIINRTPSLRGKVTAGLYVGETGASPRRRMAADHLIENRDVLRDRPPDILLTNYKMLDLLLTRPVDFPLWRHNESGVLRYLVVDELHTFDGAQGTDLACLVRRLRARLQAGDGLVCIGTSATTGGAGHRPAILDYVSSVFHQPFSSDAVVGEVRQGIDEFLEDTIISSYLVAQPRLAERMDPTRYMSSEGYIRSQHEVFFGELPAGEFETLEWRLSLGRRLREHASFVNLLRVLDGSKPTPVGAALDRLRRSLPVSGIREAELCLRALCALISVAREREGTGPEAPVRPLLNVKLHVWVRELRRMVCSLYEEREHSAASAPDTPLSGNGVDFGADQGRGSGSTIERPEEATTALERVATSDSEPEGRDGRANGPAHRIRYADDLRPDEDSIHLPLIQCRECHVTGWGCVKHAAEHRVGLDLRVFYNRFFLRDVDVNHLFPLAPDEPPPQNVRGRESKVCGRCGYLLAARDGDACPGCGLDRLTRVFRPDAVVSRRRGKSMHPELSRDCPYCGAREALIILGARASSLLSTALAQLFASRHNDDHKVIAFSDNVQDAAHRGSFFAARTWRNGIRSAIAQVVAKHEGIALGDLPDRVIEWWGRPDVNPSAFDDERFISEFIAPDRLWLRDFEALRKNGALPSGSNLLSLVQRRVRWDALGELTFGAAIGRTIERTHAAAVGVDRDALERASGKALLRIREEFGDLSGIDDLCVRSLLLGVLRRMKDRGAVASPVFDAYLRSGGNPYAIRDLALQDFGPRSTLPVFPAPTAERDGVEALFGSRRSWYQTWAEKVLTPVHLLAAKRDAADVLLVVMNALCDEELVTRVSAKNTKAWALNPARFHVTTETPVAATRAKKDLTVLSFGTPSPFLN